MRKTFYMRTDNRAMLTSSTYLLASGREPSDAGNIHGNGDFSLTFTVSTPPANNFIVTT